jgi:hypothetical protein
MTEEVQELEVETQETNPIEDLINNITAGELNKAEGSFNDILNDKLADALEAQRIQVAADVFNTPEGLDDEEDIVDETIEDEDETLELGGEGEDGLDADIEAEDEISDEEIEDAIEQVFDEDEEILAELDDDEDETEAVE